MITIVSYWTSCFREVAPYPFEGIKGPYARKDSIIIISAKDSIEDKVTGLDLGADDYLTKPFHLAGIERPHQERYPPQATRWGIATVFSEPNDISR